MGALTHIDIITTAEPMVIAPNTACNHMTGNWVKLATKVVPTIFEKTGIITAKAETKATAVATVEKIPCLTRFKLFSLSFEG